MLSRDSFEFSEVNIEDICSACDDFKEQFSKVTPEEIEKVEECYPIVYVSVCPISEDMAITISLDKCEGELCLALLAEQFKIEDNVIVEEIDNHVFDIFMPFDPEADFLPQIYRLFTENDIMVY